MENTIRSAGFASVVAHKETQTGYSSVHLLAQCIAGTGGEQTTVPVEIQIRTVLEDAWGEIDHKLRYEPFRGSMGEKSHSANGHAWQPHLNALKLLIDGCSQYADTIKKEAIENIKGQKYYLGKLAPVDDANAAIKLIGDIDEDLKSKIRSAYELSKLGHKSETLDEKSEKFKEAAATFGNIFDHCVELKMFNTDRNPVLYYFLRMEQAYNLLNEADANSLRKAVDIYEHIIIKFPEDTMAYFRLGSCLAALGEIDNAIDNYVIAQELVRADSELDEKHWVRSTITRKLGLLYWQKSLQLSDNLERKLEQLGMAYQTTEAALEFADEGTEEAITIANNLLYYAVEHNSLCKDTSKDPMAEDVIVKHLTELEGANILDKGDFYDIDTLCRAYMYLGKGDKARTCGEKIVDEIGRMMGIAKGEWGEAGYVAVTAKLSQVDRGVLDHALWVCKEASAA